MVKMNINVALSIDRIFSMGLKKFHLPNAKDNVGFALDSVSRYMSLLIVYSFDSNRRCRARLLKSLSQISGVVARNR